ncbi:MAG TPA: CapA family protein [Symbiobacteriaceae bacterium]|nr:CapA family protein [Symbiobacteriaceae bacterium]
MAYPLGGKGGRPILRKVALLLTALLALGGCAKPTQGPPPEPKPLEVVPVQAPPAPPVRGRILAVGDLLMHLPLVTISETKDGYDFTPLFQEVKPWIEGADLAIANLETTLTGPAYPYSNYPTFNTPQEFARDIKKVGFDAIVHANNHALDYGEYGLTQTSESLERAGLPHIGTARTPAEAEKILVLDVVPGIKLALLNYSYSTNGIPLPQPWSVNLLDKDRVRADVRRARQLPAVDLVAVAFHYGDEDTREPNQQQIEFNDLAIQAGADMIFGDHVHATQRVEFLPKVKDEWGRVKNRAVFYGLGNFISRQLELHQECGLIGLVDLVKQNGESEVESMAIIPTWRQNWWDGGLKRTRVVVMEKAMADYKAGTDPLMTTEAYERLQLAWNDTLRWTVAETKVPVYSYKESPVLKR